MARAARSETSDFTPPYRRSWVDRAFDWIEGLPGPVWTFYAGFFAFTFVVGFWFEAPNYPHIPGQLLTAISCIVIGGSHWLRFVSSKSMERLRPSLDLDGAAADELTYRVVVTPPKIAAVALLVEAIYLPLYVFSEAEPFGYRELPMAVFVPGFIAWLIGEAFGWVLVCTAIHRFVILGRVHRDLVRVELFRQQPLHASSAVTIRTALVMLLLFAYIPLLSLGSDAFTDPNYLGSLFAGAILAVVIAVAPLRGTHRVLADAKRERSMANGRRIQETLDGLDRAVDAGDLPTVEHKQKTLNALLGERDLLAKVPTWPWAPGTIRTFATTILVPIVLLIANKGVSRWLG